MSDLTIEELDASFGAEVRGFDPSALLDDDVRRVLQDAFDRRAVLVFRDIDLTHPQQVTLANTLIRRQDLVDAPTGPGFDDNFYISNRRPNAAAPWGRLQFHSDTMWAEEPVQVVSLYGLEVDEPAVPTTFASAAQAWATVPDDLRVRVEGMNALHTAGEVRRGDVSDVLLVSVDNPPSTVKPIPWMHPRTGVPLLYICEQMTKGIVGLSPDESESLLEELFAHMYDQTTRLNHPWRRRDFVIWDNLAVQHARPSVAADGPARTLRKVFSPIPQLAPDQLPTYSAAK